MLRGAVIAPTTTNAHGTSCSAACTPTWSRSIRRRPRSASRTRRRSSTRSRGSPIEGARKVIVLFDAERLRLNEAAANKLLKTLEEPPPRAVIVLVTAGADQLLPTIRSRCQRVDFAFLGTESVAARAAGRAGVAPERAELLARFAGGRLDRARALDGRLGPVRDAFVAVAYASTVPVPRWPSQAELIQGALRETLAELEGAQAAEIERAVERARGRGLPRTHPTRPAPPPRGTSQARAPTSAHRRAPRRDHRAGDRVPRRARRFRSGAPQPRSRRARARTARGGRCTRRVSRRAAGHRGVQPQRDPARRTAAPPPPRGRRRSQCPSGRLTPSRYTRRRAGVAQTAEQLTRNEQAKGSSPFSGSTRRIDPRPGTLLVCARDRRRSGRPRLRRARPRHRQRRTVTDQRPCASPPAPNP